MWRAAARSCCARGGAAAASAAVDKATPGHRSLQLHDDESRMAAFFSMSHRDDDQFLRVVGGLRTAPTSRCWRRHASRLPGAPSMRIARGASWTSCELRDASCASESAVPHGAKERSAGGMWWPRARSPWWFSLQQMSRSCTMRGVFVFARGGVTFLSSLLFAPLRSTSALAATPPLSRRASRERGSASGKRDVRLACMLRAARNLLSSHSRSLPRLCRVSFLSCACRFFAALSSACSARHHCCKSSTVSATRPPKTGNKRAARRRGVAFAPVISRWRAPVRARARSVPLCAVCGMCGPSGRWPLASSPAAWLAYLAFLCPRSVRGGITTAAAAPFPLCHGIKRAGPVWCTGCSVFRPKHAGCFANCV